jgi:hypothetical protein
MYYEVRAVIPGAGYDNRIVGCFDPTRVVARLKDEIPEVVVEPRDHSQKDVETFKRLDNAGAALEIAEADARRRGPMWRIALPMADGRELKGHEVDP